MDTVVYLVFWPKRRGYARYGLIRATHKQPALEPGERAIRLEVNIPDRFFQPAAVPTARLDVPEEMLSPPVPDVTVQPFPEES
jgi:hypothetical protein